MLTDFPPQVQNSIYPIRKWVGKKQLQEGEAEILLNIILWLHHTGQPNDGLCSVNFASVKRSA